MSHNNRKSNRIRLPELLAPAGSFVHMKAAFQAGADAVYMGGQRFGARAYADNFSGDDLREALRYARFYNKKLYLTVNTLIKERELEEQLYDFLFPFYEEGLDGVIVQDPGAADFIRQHFAGMEIHGSTQMTITDVYGARAAARLGMNRIVPARELSLKEIVRIKKETGLDIEVFVHGALCYCYSGQCLLSSMYGGRSGNRGRCAQPCRLPYRLDSGAESHLLSPKDLCALPLLPSLIAAGVDSLKIEGRMKNVEYVAGVTAVYRKYLDLYRLYDGEGRQKEWQVEEKDYHILEELYSRTGFTDGYWNRHNGARMMSTAHPRNLGRKIGQIAEISGHRIGVRLERDVVLHPKDILVLPLKEEEIVLTVPSGETKKRGLYLLNVPKTGGLRRGMDVYRRRNEEVSRRIEEEILQKEQKMPVAGEISIKIGKPVWLALRCGENTVRVEGENAELSSKRPLTEEDVLRQMHKTGGVPFVLDELTLEMDEKVFYPMSRLKELRQMGFQKLREQKEVVSRRENISLQFDSKSDTVISLNNRKIYENVQGMRKKMAVVYDREALRVCVSLPFFDSICLPAAFWTPDQLKDLAQEIRGYGRKVFLSMPDIMRSGYTSMEEICRMEIWTGIYANTMGQAQFLYELEGRRAPILASPSFYHWNHRSADVSREMFHLAGMVLPLELSGREYEEMLSGMSDTARDDLFSVETHVYGRVPVMRSAQCPKKTMGACNHRQEILYLMDRKNRRLPVVSHCGACYTSVWTDRPVNLIGEEAGRLAKRIDGAVFHFFLDDEAAIRRAVEDFTQWETRQFAADPRREPDRRWNNGIE